MQFLPIKTQSMPGRSSFGYIHQATVASDDTPVAVGLAGVERNKTVAVYPQTGSARVEQTTSAIQQVMDDTAIWRPWPWGDVTEPTEGVIDSGVTALRLITTGSAYWEINA